MRVNLRFTAILAIACLPAALALTTGAAPVSADQQQVCAGTPENMLCLNDTLNGGFGSKVQMWTPNATNEDFHVNVLFRCEGGVQPGDTVTPNCPFANTGLDVEFNTELIVQLEYRSTNLCIAENPSTNTSPGVADAMLGTCNQSGGFGGSAGTIFVLNAGQLISLWASNQLKTTNQAGCLSSGDFTTGAPAVYSTRGCDSWGGL